MFGVFLQQIAEDGAGIGAVLVKEVSLFTAQAVRPLLAGCTLGNGQQLILLFVDSFISEVAAAIRLASPC